MIPASFMPYSIIFTLAMMMGLFIWGRWRYELVALFGLAFATLIGAVPFNQIYTGLNNPAVITVACIMIISNAISNSGLIRLLIDKLEIMTKYQMLHISFFSIITALLSAFMNNVGALGIMLPACIDSSLKQNRSPSLILMPVAVASALGGMMTLIGTPPNLIISSFREQSLGKVFSMFDFSYVGVVVAFFGVLFVIFFGWRLLPERRSTKKHFSKKYIAEIKVPSKSEFIGKTLGDMKLEILEAIEIIGIIRRKRKQELKESFVIKSGDIMLMEATIEDIQAISKNKNLHLENQFQKQNVTGDWVVVEAIVPTASKFINKELNDIKLSSKYKASVLALHRNIDLPVKKISQQKIQAGDIILLQCKEPPSSEDLYKLGLIPIARPSIQIGSWFKTLLPIIIFACAIVLTVMSLLPVDIAFGMVVIFIFLLKPSSLRNIHRTIDWSIIVLLAAMLPLGAAFIKTGGAGVISALIFSVSHNLSPIFIIGLILAITMTLSDLINNAATAIVMAPIAISLSKTAGINVDALLMAVAVGASCAFLTPIGHQNNLLVMGPGNYKFFDYMRLGLPLEIVIVVVATPLIYWVWY